jgi:hypothetical protein
MAAKLDWSVRLSTPEDADAHEGETRMGKRDRFQDHPDPDWQNWGRTYRSFPGVAECVRVVLDLKATGCWSDIVVYELTRNAHDHLQELIDAFREHVSDNAARYLLQALEAAALPESVGLFSELLSERDPRFVPYAERALQAIDTREARAALFRARHAK